MKISLVALLLAVIASTTSFAATTPDEDWIARSTHPDVVRAIRFDSESEYRNNLHQQGRDNAYDTNVKASGGGSLRFDIKSNTGEGDGGSWRVNFSEDLQTQFGAGDEFWVQWRQRFDEFYITHNYDGGGWKQAIIGEGDRPGFEARSCSDLEIVWQNNKSVGYPGAYHNCGDYGRFYHVPDAEDGELSTQNQLWRDGCWVASNAGEQGNKSGCFKYEANEWMTFMTRVKLGSVGTANSTHGKGNNHQGFTNSTIELFVARDGQDFVKIHSQDGVVFRGGSNTVKYGKVWLLPYHTDKNAGESHQNASTWYDELIVSTSRIAAPGVPGSSGGGDDDDDDQAPTPAPTVSISAQPSTILSGESSQLTWSSTNATACASTGSGWSGAQNEQGSASVSPNSTTLYALTCTGLGGQTTRNVTVTVNDAPQNSKPTQPIIPSLGMISPGGEMLDSMQYVDPDGDALGFSRWHIATSTNFSNSKILNLKILGTTQLAIAPGILDPNTNYWVRTRHADAQGNVSPWSEVVMFTTSTQYPWTDVDNNGVDDEYQVDNPANNADCALKDAAQTGEVGFDSDLGSMNCYTVTEGAEVSSSVEFPYGLFSFSIDGLTPGEQVDVTIYLPEALSNPTWYKYDEALDAVYDFSENVTFNGNRVTLRLTDGGAGDADGIANGVIVDPSGPSGSSGGGSSASASGDDGGSSGALGYWWILSILSIFFMGRRYRQA